MIYIIASLLSLGVLGYILQPFYRSQKQSQFIPADEGNPVLVELNKNKNELLAAIKEIDFEFQMGKIAMPDYEKLKAEYQNRALQVLKEIDELTSARAPADDLENEIRRYRQKLKESTSVAGKPRFCPYCGEKVESQFKFCANCGKKLLFPS